MHPKHLNILNVNTLIHVFMLKSASFCHLFNKKYIYFGQTI